MSTLSSKAGSSPRPIWVDLLIAIVPVVAASLLGSAATVPQIPGWYATLAKPPFNPPNWVFAPVWAALYMLMALAVWRIVRRPPSPARRWALILFFIQLALNATWPWMFFTAHSPLMGLINIIPQCLFIAAAIVAFVRLDWIAALALVPLLAWVGYASALNYFIWQMNG
jgi:translocator protein